MAAKKGLSDSDQYKYLKKEDHVEPPKDDESNWLVSYADMMTLLCGFFILLFSMDQMEESKYDSFKEALSKQFGGEYVSQKEVYKEFATQILKDSGLETGAVVKANSSGVAITFESTVFFETLSAEVTTQGKETLSKLIQGINQNQLKNSKSYRIIVEGHTDGRPILSGMYPSNWELSGARAARVVRMFLDQGFNAQRLTAIGYADTHPLVESRSEDGKWNDVSLAKNRRVVLRILEPKVEAIPIPSDEIKPIESQAQSETTPSTAAPALPGTAISTH
jgi:chemotaxis protein MotB